MPIYEFVAREPETGCPHCAHGFEQTRRMSDPPLEKCPHCGAPVRKVYSAPALPEGKSGFDARAKCGGFQKLQLVGKGEYEKKY